MYDFCYHAAAWFGILVYCVSILGSAIRLLHYLSHREWAVAAFTLVLGILLAPLAMLLGVLIGFRIQLQPLFKPKVDPAQNEQLPLEVLERARDMLSQAIAAQMQHGSPAPVIDSPQAR